ncbi:MAG: class I SAM-dependent methyltransferase [Desulfobacterales bacterium]|jgi:predicted O-methyltransferase YrrM|nr:class I SAM-dependent methyltransferase [Desulfobacteraceae bacterium]MBT7085773.1 class I SAM-dependent methyltransferase [Desulfobacterales bacterium]
MREILYGFYGTMIYLPLSGLSRKWRRFSMRINNKEGGFLQQINLPGISWKQCTNKKIIEIREHDEVNGNIRISELGVINAIAADCEDGTNIFEIGTFDGRTSLNIAFSSPSNCSIYTLDLPAKTDTQFSLAPGEEHMVEKEKSGARLEKYRESDSSIVSKIHNLFGDSASFDYSPYYKSCSLIFVDGSHAYEYALSDTYAAMKMVKKGGVIIWHDYGIWEGVTRALEEIEEKEKIGLKNIRGTSLVYWKKE